MKATGIVRRIDDLGRVVIPKEIRRTLAIREGDLWNNVRRAVNNYIMDFGMIELFTEDHSFMLDADSFSIPGEINPLD